MQPKWLALLASVLPFLAAAGSAQQPSPPKTPPTSAAAPAAVRALTLPEALRFAEAANPALRSRQAQLSAAEGLRRDAAGMLFNNPQLSVDQVRRSVPRDGAGTERRSEWGAGVSQTFEIAGQQGYRRELADAALSALRFEIADTRRQVRAEATARFYRVLALQQRTAVETRAVKLFEDTAAAVDKRRAAGEDTRLDANVARVEAERARNQLAVAGEQLLDARVELATTLQLPPASLPEATGDLALVPDGYSLATLLSAVEAQPRLRALAERENSAAARLKLERASTYPDVTVGVNTAREGPSIARERLTTVSVSLPLPIFRRNAAGIGQATTELSQVRIDRQSQLRDAQAGVSALWAKRASLEARVRRLQQSVLPALDDNQRLSLRSRQAGQIGLLELIVVNRQALDARRDLIEALAEYHATRLALEASAGWPQDESRP